METQKPAATVASEAAKPKPALPKKPPVATKPVGFGAKKSDRPPAEPEDDNATLSVKQLAAKFAKQQN